VKVEVVEVVLLVELDGGRSCCSSSKLQAEKPHAAMTRKRGEHTKLVMNLLACCASSCCKWLLAAGCWLKLADTMTSS